MKTWIAIFGLMISFSAQAALPDLTGNYSGCGVHSASGKQQMVLILVRMPNGMNDFKYSGGFYLKTASAQVGTDFFTDVRIDEATGRILMMTDVVPKRDHGMIAKTVDAKLNADGSITGELLTNATGADGRFQFAKFTVTKVDGLIKPLVCK